MEDTNEDEWQWWRISFSADDAKTQQAAKAEKSERKNAAPKNADIIGFTTTKVREIEVLKAARDSSSVLLVYANSKYSSFQSDIAPPALQVCSEAISHWNTGKANAVAGVCEFR
jgi:hypothetical protein